MLGLLSDWLQSLEGMWFLKRVCVCGHEVRGECVVLAFRQSVDGVVVAAS